MDSKLTYDGWWVQKQRDSRELSDEELVEKYGVVEHLDMVLRQRSPREDKAYRRQTDYAFSMSMEDQRAAYESAQKRVAQEYRVGIQPDTPLEDLVVVCGCSPRAQPHAFSCSPFTPYRPPACLVCRRLLCHPAQYKAARIAYKLVPDAIAFVQMLKGR